jgi:hypothetical protein
MVGRGLLIPAIAWLMALVVACGGGSSGGGGGGGGDSNTWVGKLEEGDAYIAIMKKELAHLVYVTDGKALALWFKGNVGLAGGGYFQFQDQDLHAVNARPQGSNYVGTVTVSAGKHVPFTAIPAKGEAGLYRAKDADGMSGWIVLEDGSVRGAKVSESGEVEGQATLGGVRWTDPAAEP